MLYVAAAYLLVLTGTSWLQRTGTSAPVALPRRLPSTGRVIIPNVPSAADVRMDDTEIAIAASAPGGDAGGCSRHRGAGDAGAGDRVECRLPAYELHRFELREPGRDIDNWYIEIPADEHEAILTR